MQENNAIYKMIREHTEKYPRMQITDYFKLLYHSAFGCEHAVSSYDTALEWIEKEKMSDLPEDDETMIEELCGDYARVYILTLRRGLSPRTLTSMFCLSAKKEENGRERLEKGLAVLKECAERGEVPVTKKELDEAVKEWEALGYPAVRHSEIYRECYKPAYRVVAKKYAEQLQNLMIIDFALSHGDTGTVMDLYTNLLTQSEKDVLTEICRYASSQSSQ